MLVSFHIESSKVLLVHAKLFLVLTERDIISNKHESLNSNNSI